MNHLEKTPSLCLPYVADDSLLCKLGSGVCPSLKHLDVQVASNVMTLMLVMMTTMNHVNANHYHDDHDHES